MIRVSNKPNIEELTDMYIEDINEIMDKKMNGTYRNANNRISFLAIQINDFQELFY